VDNHSWPAYTEILPDETKQTAIAFWTRAQAFFQATGVEVKRVLTDNGWATDLQPPPRPHRTRRSTNRPRVPNLTGQNT
jgi:hypothetical protein